MDWNKISKQLSEPFSEEVIKWKPQASKGDKEGMVAYVDARDVMNRLDSAVGPAGWADSYRLLPDGSHVECTITIDGISKSDVGEPNTGGFADKVKSAYSDAFKRAAVKWGIGRDLYDIDMQWTRKGQRPQTAVKPKPPKAAANGHSVADIRLTISEGAPQTTIGLVVDRAAQTGKFKNAHEALTAAKEWGEWPDNYKVEMKTKFKQENAVRLFDWLVNEGV